MEEDTLDRWAEELETYFVVWMIARYFFWLARKYRRSNWGQRRNFWIWTLAAAVNFALFMSNGQSGQPWFIPALNALLWLASWFMAVARLAQ